MQIHESSLNGAERPCAPKDCARCGGCRKLQRHGKTSRYRGTQGARRVDSQRYLCPQCNHTWSVIPEDMVPYRSMEVSRFQKLMDDRFGLAGRSTGPPPATEKELGGIRRAIKTLSERIPLLCGLLGQQMPLGASADVGCFWRALRELGSTGDILVRLARDFKTSLLGCYGGRCAHWAREVVPG